MTSFLDPQLAASKASRKERRQAARPSESDATARAFATFQRAVGRDFRKADNQDSMLDVLIYKEAGYKMVLDSLRGLTFGNFDLMASTAYFQTESFTVTANREVPMEVDGELAGRSSEFKFKETPNRLRVLAPDGPLGGSFAETLKSFFQWPKRQAGEPDAQPSTRRT